eukprot:8321573-Karenia_brevis.AAC.1
MVFNCTSYCNNAVGISARQLYARWRLELERTLLFEVADIYLLAMGHASGLRALHGRRGSRGRWGRE